MFVKLVENQVNATKTLETIKCQWSLLFEKGLQLLKGHFITEPVSSIIEEKFAGMDSWMQLRKSGLEAVYCNCSLHSTTTSSSSFETVVIDVVSQIFSEVQERNIAGSTVRPAL